MSLPQPKLPQGASSILLIKSLPFKITSAELYTLFGKYGAITQIRLGNTNETRGRAFVVYESIYDAIQACTHLNGFNVNGRYIVVLYYQVNKIEKPNIDVVRHQRATESQAINQMKTKLAV